VGAAHGRDSLCGDTEEALRTAAAFRGRIAAVGLDVPFCLKAIKGGVDGADGHLALGPQLNLLPHGDTVSLISQAQECQDNDVLKFAEVIAVSHFLYKIDEIALDRYGDIVKSKRATNDGAHISLVFREMWDTAVVDRKVYRTDQKSEGKSGGIPYLAKNERDMGHPSFVRKRESDY